MQSLKNLVRQMYLAKIKVMFYFSLGYGEVNGIISMVKDIVIILGFMVLVFKVHLGIWHTVLLAIGCFAAFILLGAVLKHTGMSDFATKVNNSVNPELKLINRIAEKLGIVND